MNLQNTRYPSVLIGVLGAQAEEAFKIGPFGSTLKKDELTSTGIPVVGIENVLPNRFLANYKRFISEEKFEQLKRYSLREGDVLVTTMGTIGRAAVVPANVERAIMDSHLFRMRLDQDKVEPAFLSYALNGLGELKENLNQKAGGAIMAGLNTGILKSCAIPLPPLIEQRRIVAILEKQLGAVERALAACEAQLEAGRYLWSAYLREAFDSPEAKAWPLRLLADLSEIVGGIQKTPDRAPTSFHRPFLTVRNVQRGFLDLTRVERFEITPEELERVRLQDGDLLIVEGNGSVDQIGRNAIFVADHQEWIHQNHIIRVRLDQGGAIPAFISSYLNCPSGLAQLFEKSRTSSGLYTLSAGKVASLKIPIPSVDRQAATCRFLSEREELTKGLALRVSECLDSISEIPPKLLERAFRGDLSR